MEKLGLGLGGNQGTLGEFTPLIGVVTPGLANLLSSLKEESEGPLAFTSFLSGTITALGLCLYVTFSGVLWAGLARCGAISLAGEGWAILAGED